MILLVAKNPGNVELFIFIKHFHAFVDLDTAGGAMKRLMGISVRNMAVSAAAEDIFCLIENIIKTPVARVIDASIRPFKKSLGAPRSIRL